MSVLPLVAIFSAPENQDGSIEQDCSYGTQSSEMLLKEQPGQNG
jgi:hypothetical protein